MYPRIRKWRHLTEFPNRRQPMPDDSSPGWLKDLAEQQQEPESFLNAVVAHRPDGTDEIDFLLDAGKGLLQLNKPKLAVRVLQCATELAAAGDDRRREWECRYSRPKSCARLASYARHFTNWNMV